MKRESYCGLDGLYVLGTALFFFGCIASSNCSGLTLDPGQASVGASYLQANTVEEDEADPIRLAGLDVRFGAARGLDFGLGHTWDVTRDGDGLASTAWFDFKAQLNNHDRLLGRPTMSLGLTKGYVYHEEGVHITSLPVYLSIPATPAITPFVVYRHELFSEGFLPDGLDNPRNNFAVGVEFDLTQGDGESVHPKLGFSLGTLNSLGGGGEGDRILTLNVGLSVDTP